MLIPAAQYLRTSRLFQEAYLDRQRMIISEYAKQHGFMVVRTYSDPGRSGIVLRQRPAMQRLLNDVLQGDAPYESILVYDVSRWGRFQDVDEAAHYEFLCMRSGISVQYCDEPYVNGGGVGEVMLKNMRRSQAGEFSRELGVKVFRGEKNIAAQGFRTGGAAGYGLRRLMVSQDGRPIQQLEAGEWKYRKTYRTILTPGPAKEVEVVREIFSMASTGRFGCAQIAGQLNRRGIPYPTGHQWNYYHVLRMITNPKYMGQNAWGRTSETLKGPRRKVDPANWTIKDGAFVPIVDPKLFQRLQISLRTRRKPPWSDDELIARLKALLQKNGKLSQRIIDRTPGMPSSSTFYAHFGPLRKVYPLIGYEPQKETFTKVLRRDQNETLRVKLLSKITNLFGRDISVFHLRNHRRLILRIDNGLSISVVLCRSLKLSTGAIGWKIYPTRSESEYITLLCRLTARNNGLLDYRLFPFIEKRTPYKFTAADPWFRKGKRVDDLNELCRAAKAISRLDDDARILQPVTHINLPPIAQSCEVTAPRSSKHFARV